MKQNHSQENSVKIAKILKRLHKKVVLAIITDWINVRRVTGAINTFIKFGNPRHDNYWGGEDLLSGYAIALDYIKIKEKEKDMDLRDAYEKIYGADSFTKFWEDWDQLVELESTELRVLVN